MIDIEVDIKGQFGNQAFQYAFARALQLKYGGNVTLNLYNFKKYSPPYFNMELSSFELEKNIVLSFKKLPFYANEHFFITKFFMKYLKKITFLIMSRFGVYLWNSCRSSVLIPERKHKKIYAVGYWQDPSYFSDCVDILRKDFQPKEVGVEAKKFLKEIASSLTICVSVRRGDFLSSKNVKNFYVCNKDYFMRCIAEFKKIFKNPKFVFFSDDLAFIKNEFSGIDIDVVYEPEGLTISEKLFVMSNCKHFILSNSSFSWWAQFLSKNDDKIIMAPSKWYNTGKNKRGKLYSDNWRIINS